MGNFINLTINLQQKSLLYIIMMFITVHILYRPPIKRVLSEFILGHEKMIIDTLHGMLELGGFPNYK